MAGKEFDSLQNFVGSSFLLNAEFHEIQLGNICTSVMTEAKTLNPEFKQINKPKKTHIFFIKIPKLEETFLLLLDVL